MSCKKALQNNTIDNQALLELDEQSFNSSIINHNNSGKTLSWAHLLKVAHQLSEALPAHSHYIANLATCFTDFWLISFAAAIAGKELVLPPNALESTQQTYAERFPGLFSADQAFIHTVIKQKSLSQSIQDQQTQIILEQAKIHVATSGSSGQAKCHMTTWQQRLTAAAQTAQRFVHWQNSSMISTVPGQHMYGLEHALFWPLLLNSNIDDSIYCYPADIQQRLANDQNHQQVILITTPFHLKACVESGLAFKQIKGILSATAPLPTTLAQQAARCFQTTVHEIYGSTETGAIASRKTCGLKPTAWQLFPHLSIEQIHNKHGEQQALLVNHATQSHQALHDQILQLENDCFELGDRHHHLIKVAGKRTSLAALKQTVCSINGIQDCAFLNQQTPTDLYARLILFITLKPNQQQTIQQLKQAVRSALKKQHDPVFLPRELYITQLPYNSCGKLPKTQLEQLLIQCRNKNATHSHSS